jgi:hypothetical protein
VDAVGNTTLRNINPEGGPVPLAHSDGRDLKMCALVGDDEDKERGGIGAGRKRRLLATYWEMQEWMVDIVFRLRVDTGSELERAGVSSRRGARR